MIPPSQSTRPAGRAILAGVGDFGQAVVELMLRRPGRSVVGADRIDDAFQDDAVGTIVLAMWRPCPALCEKVDELAFMHGRSWLPIVMNHPHVRIGPLVVPELGACFGCFQERQVQHDSQRAVRAVVNARYDSDPCFGPEGYLGHHARLAASLAELALAGAHDEAGQVRTVNVMATGIRRHAVVPRPDCTRCTRSTGQGGRSALADLVRGLTAVGAGIAGSAVSTTFAGGARDE
jgi:bacteriocin biosynthesis cyclodehydratase domain-containing protein